MVVCEPVEVKTDKVTFLLLFKADTAGSNPLGSPSD